MLYIYKYRESCCFLGGRGSNARHFDLPSSLNLLFSLARFKNLRYTKICVLYKNMRYIFSNFYIRVAPEKMETANYPKKKIGISLDQKEKKIRNNDDTQIS